MNVPDWLKKVQESLPTWLEKLSVKGQPGRFYPCLDGRTKVGEDAVLGFSCFALKIFYITGLWDKLGLKEKNAWLDFIRSFQHPSSGAFLDRAILDNCDPLLARIRRFFFSQVQHKNLSHLKATIIAETKQAIATLDHVGARASYPYREFPQNPAELNMYLKSLDWVHPWAAGGQSAAIAVFVKNESPKILSLADSEKLLEIVRRFFTEFADSQTGAWFIGRCPAHGELINGAMKVLTALEWLECEIPYPKQLIDTCLAYPPKPEGCHLVDYIYVLYRCQLQTSHRQKEITKRSQLILDMVSKHFQMDGAFSYFVDGNQVSYYGAKFAKSLKQSDIQGTFLLCYAIAIIGKIIELNDFKWRLIKP